MKLVGYLMCRNELRHGNLRRCLDNLRRYCDEIVVYDDGSDDGSLEVIRSYTPHVIEGPGEGLRYETRHRQDLLELALSLAPDYVFWLDADEVLDRRGTEGGLRELCATGKSYNFEEVTLWRSQTWRRLDYLGRGYFRRLWNVRDRMVQIPYSEGLHRQLYPDGLSYPWDSKYRVLHYGYASQARIERRWRERTALGVPVDLRRKCLDESRLELELVPADWYPDGSEQPPMEPRPEPIRYAEELMREAGL